MLSDGFIRYIHHQSRGATPCHVLKCNRRCEGLRQLSQGTYILIGNVVQIRIADLNYVTDEYIGTLG